MTERTSRGVRRVWWVAALVAVPTALAGLAMLWPGTQLSADLGRQSERALDEAGLTAVTVRVDGRDAALAGVPSGAERAAVDAVAAVPGIRTVRPPAALPAAPPTGTVPTAAIPSSPDGGTAPRDAARQQLVSQVAAAVAAGPVLFGPDAAELAGSPAATVRRVAALLVAEPEAAVLVEGHVADTPGSPEAGEQLSERRAAVVAEALAAAGVDPSRITTRGRGAELPLATPADSRRAEIVVS